MKRGYIQLKEQSKLKKSRIFSVSNIYFPLWRYEKERLIDKLDLLHIPNRSYRDFKKLHHDTLTFYLLQNNHDPGRWKVTVDIGKET